MPTFAETILSAAKGEPIEAIIISKGDRYYDAPPPEPLLLMWAQAQPLLDYEWNSGYGSPDCHAIYAWTASRVLFVGTYDGATWVTSVPRHPAAELPTMVGGG